MGLDSSSVFANLRIFKRGVRILQVTWGFILFSREFFKSKSFIGGGFYPGGLFNSFLSFVEILKSNTAMYL